MIVWLDIHSCIQKSVLSGLQGPVWEKEKRAKERNELRDLVIQVHLHILVKYT
jgi:hypothetical protein